MSQTSHELKQMHSPHIKSNSFACVTGDWRLSFLWKCRLVWNRQSCIFHSFTAQLYCTPTICECLEPWFMQSWVTLAQKKWYSYTEKSLLLIVISIMHKSTIGLLIYSSHEGCRDDTAVLEERLVSQFWAKVGEAPWAKVWLPGSHATPANGHLLQAWVQGKALGRVHHCLISFISCTIHLDFYL